MTEVKSYESTVLMGAAVESGVYGLTALLLVIGIACKVGLYLILLILVVRELKPNYVKKQCSVSSFIIT